MPAKGVRVWICEGCGKRETWRAGWGYLPGVESTINRDEDGKLLPVAGCSRKCLDDALDDLCRVMDV